MNSSEVIWNITYFFPEITIIHKFFFYLFFLNKEGEVAYFSEVPSNPSSTPAASKGVPSACRRPLRTGLEDIACWFPPLKWKFRTSKKKISLLLYSVLPKHYAETTKTSTPLGLKTHESSYYCLAVLKLTAWHLHITHNRIWKCWVPIN